MDETYLRNFYQTNLPILPPFSSWRQFRFRRRIEDTTLIKIKDRIHTPQQLQKYLVKYAPVDAWCTASCFMQPDFLSRKLKYWKKPRNNEEKAKRFMSNMFIRGDFVLEIDSNDQGNIERALELLKSKGFSSFMCIKTHRGVHIWVLDFWDKWCTKKIPMPGNRENYFKLQKMKLANLLEKEGIDFDYATTVDSRRIVRIPNTMHNAGVVCKIIDNPFSIGMGHSTRPIPCEAKACDAIPLKKMTVRLKMKTLNRSSALKGTRPDIFIDQLESGRCRELFGELEESGQSLCRALLPSVDSNPYSNPFLPKIGR